MQGTDKLNTITNIVFVLTDVLETNLLEMQQQYKKEGFELRHDSKRNFNTAIAAIKRLKSDVNHCSESTQENFGNDSDMVNAMLLTLIDSCDRWQRKFNGKNNSEPVQTESRLGFG